MSDYNEKTKAYHKAVAVHEEQKHQKGFVKRLQTQTEGPLLIDQARAWLTLGKTRKRNPMRPETVLTYSSQLENHIIPELGAIPVDAVGNKRLNEFVQKLTEKKLSANTIQLNINIIKQIRASVKNDDGQERYPYSWNAEMIDAPIVDKKTLKTPIASAQAVQDGLSCPTASQQTKNLLALLAGSGLRIQEALALRFGPDDGKSTVWLPDDSKIIVRLQRTDSGDLAPTKTSAGDREVDIHPELNQFLLKNVSRRLPEAPMSRDGLLPISDKPRDTRLVFWYSESKYRQELLKCGVTGGFHSLRRFRVTHLRLKAGVSDSLVHFWIGHEDQTVTDRYTKAGPEIEHRKQEAVRAGLGFTI